MHDKEQFGVNMENQLREWQETVEAKKAEAEKKGHDFWERVAPDFDSLASKYEEAKYKLKLLRMSGADAWDEVRGGFEKAFDEFKRGVDNALKKL